MRDSSRNPQRSTVLMCGVRLLWKQRIPVDFRWRIKHWCLTSKTNCFIFHMTYCRYIATNNANDPRVQPSALMMALGNMCQLVFIVSVWNNELFMVCSKLLLGWRREGWLQRGAKGWVEKPENVKRQKENHVARSGGGIKQIWLQISCH